MHGTRTDMYLSGGHLRYSQSIAHNWQSVYDLCYFLNGMKEIWLRRGIVFRWSSLDLSAAAGLVGCRHTRLTHGTLYMVLNPDWWVIKANGFVNDVSNDNRAQTGLRHETASQSAIIANVVAIVLATNSNLSGTLSTHCSLPLSKSVDPLLEASHVSKPFS